MKQIKLKALLVAVGLYLSNAVMAQFSITYDFKTYCESLGLAKNKTADNFSRPMKKGRISGVAGSVDFYYIEDYSYKGKDFYFDNNFAMQDTDDIIFRNGGTSALQGTNKNTRYIAIVNLKAGDKVTVKCSEGIKFGNANVTEEVTAGTTAVANDVEYEIKEDGDLAFAFSQWAYIYSVTIESSVEFLKAPKCIKETAQDGTSKVLTVSHGRTNDPEANLVTYYTTNEGEDPATSENRQEYKGSITVSEPSTYYFKTINTHTNKVSALTIVDVSEAGATPKLNAPTASITGFEKNEKGFYNPVYTFASDLTGVPGTPQISYAYSFEGGEATEAATYKSVKAGKLNITVSADGYESASAEVDVLGGDYFKAKSYDFTSVSLTDLTETEQTTTAGDQDVNKTGCHHYAISDSKSTLFKGITLNNFHLAIGITAGKTIGVYTRVGKGSVDVSMREKQIALFNAHHRTATNAGYDESIVLFCSTGNESINVPQYTLLKSADIYELVSENVSVSIGEASYMTFSRQFDVDFSAAESLTVYTAKLSDAKDVVTLTEVADKKVPAGQGVLLKGTGEFTGVVTTGVAAFEANDLIANTEATVVTREDNIYVLNNVDGIGFYPFVGTLTVGKAHLVIEGGNAKSIKIAFGGDTTGISNVESKAAGETEVWHTLSGVRVQNPTKGLYIVNGKKVVVK
ncbi:MAG: hypothetical protein J6K19_02485 [Prevotella sp.]|nr:hypothetical protein [Prevotella sp.]